MCRSKPTRLCVSAVLIAAAAGQALANPPPPRQRDPISLDKASPSVVGFGSTWSDLYGDNPMPPGMGWDVGGPGPVMHVLAPFYGVTPIPDDNDGLSNNEFNPFVQQVIFFSVDNQSIGRPGSPVRNQAVRLQHAGDRWVLNGRSSTAPAVGPFPATRVGGLPGPRHLLSANQTAYNEIPSIPPGAFNLWGPPAGATPMDDMDGLELNPIDLNGDLVHDTIIYFTLAMGSPTLGAFGTTGGSILVAPPGGPVAGIYAPFFSMGLSPADDIDALAVWNLQNDPLVANPGQDYAIFSLTRGSPYLNGPDGIAGTADDYSPADIFVTNFTGVSTRFMLAAQLGLLATDNIDGLDVEPFQGPQVFDWWVQRFNIDVVFIPPPGWPPNQPANDLHIILPGLDVEQVFDLWTGSFPNAVVEAVPGGVRINWWGRPFFPGQVAHIGWTISDTTTLPEQPIQIYWTYNGQPIPQPIPDNIQRWFWNGNENVVDRLPNFSAEPLFVQRRVNRLPVPVTMQDLLVGSPLWETAQIIDPAPLPLMPDSFFDVFFELDIHRQDPSQTFSVMYDVFNANGQRVATHLNAMTMIRTPELEQEGACCFGSSCQIASPDFCAAWGGTFSGVGVPCEGFQCAPAVCVGDVNCDGVVDFFDIDPFVAVLGGNLIPGCPPAAADTDGDGDVDFFDIDPFVQRLGTVCP